MQSLVKTGMSADLAQTLAREYLNKVAQRSSVHTLMDFFSRDSSKTALHAPEVDMDGICLNYQSSTPQL